MNVETPETISGVAILYDGEIYTGTIHPLILEEIKREHPDKEITGYKEGYLTTAGRFMDREEAKRMAHEQDLLRPGRDKRVDKELWTEYLQFGIIKPDIEQ